MPHTFNKIPTWKKSISECPSALGILLLWVCHMFKCSNQEIDWLGEGLISLLSIWAISRCPCDGYGIGTSLLLLHLEPNIGVEALWNHSYPNQCPADSWCKVQALCLKWLASESTDSGTGVRWLPSKSHHDSGKWGALTLASESPWLWQVRCFDSGQWIAMTLASCFDSRQGVAVILASESPWL